MPRSSKGCRNCVRRRIKCDGTKPGCVNCQKRGLECGGYQTLVIIYSAQPRSLGPSSSSRRHQRTDDTHTSERAESRYHEIPPSPGTAPRQDDDSAYLCYLEYTYEADPNFRLYREEGNPNWISECLMRRKNLPTAFQSIQCLAYGWYGRANKHEPACLESTRRYSNALIALQMATTVPGEAFYFDILMAITALMRYENLMLTSEKGWIAHAGGIGRVFQLMGPEVVYGCWINTAILEAHRAHITFQSHLQHQRTFLADSAWSSKNAPHNRKDPLLRNFEDLYAQLTIFVEQMNSKSVDVSDNSSQMGVTARKERYLLDVEKLDEMWREQYFHHTGINAASGHLRKLYSDSNGLVFEQVFHFSSAKAAITRNLCRMLRIIVLTWSYDPDIGPAEEDENEIVQLAKDICCSLHYHLDRNGTASSVFHLLLCCSVAYHALESGGREQRWLSKLLDQVAIRYGLSIARQLQYMETIPFERHKQRGTT